jgi:predicted RNase H-like HicB family nuclease
MQIAKEYDREKDMYIDVIITETQKNYSASLPLLPGCVTTGNTTDEIMENVREIVPFHLEGMRMSGEQIPKEFDGRYSYNFKFP